MASRIGGRNNCPTSDRDGITVDPTVERQALAEIDAVVGPLTPGPYDRWRDHLWRNRGAVFIPDVDADAADANDAAETDVALEDMDGPSAAELAEIEADPEIIDLEVEQAA